MRFYFPHLGDASTLDQWALSLSEQAGMLADYFLSHSLSVERFEPRNALVERHYELPLFRGELERFEREILFRREIRPFLLELSRAWPTRSSQEGR